MSERGDLDKQELRKWAVNTLIFLAPALLVFLLQIQDGKTVNEAVGAIYVWMLSTSIDMLKKFVKES